MKKKLYVLPDATVETLHKIMEEKGFKTEVSCVVYAIDNFYQNTSLAQTIADEIDSRYKKIFTRLRLGIGAAERNTYLILDVLNSMLYDSNTVDLIKASGDTMHKIIKQSADDYKKMIERNKQIHDNDSLKKGEK